LNRVAVVVKAIFDDQTSHLSKDVIGELALILSELARKVIVTKDICKFKVIFNSF
jgi:hypothetical protein